MLGTVLEERYKLLKKLHQGQLTEIYKAQDIKTKGKVAIKLEIFPNDSNILSEIQFLSKIYYMQGFPKLLFQGNYRGRHYFGTNYLGKSLKTKFSQTKNKFSIGCVLRIAEELLLRIESLHKAEILHRNIKPENILTGYGFNWQILSLINYSSALLITDTNHPHKRSQAVTNLLYSSVNSMSNTSYSKKDDLESIFYILIHFCTGKLPWIREKLTDRQIIRLKEQISTQDLCEGCPNEFVHIISYIKNLKCDDIPDYEMIRCSLKEISKKKKIIRNYDWVLSHEKMIAKAKTDKSKIPFNWKLSIKKQAEKIGVIDVFEKKKITFGFATILKAKSKSPIRNIDEKKEEEASLTRSDTPKVDTYPEIQNRVNLFKLRKEFLTQSFPS
ncbi:hypothetical protein SteCoe_9001 [Stentor coeruleus]|uniref:Casein kinase I n=1 Tax=Stentor coeruleus TaxID=5963 RepID=A0A1R2CIP2_9CILI|nr:hypothetical protein SteCoe_9001 [Stentor coeruleus]